MLCSRRLRAGLLLLALCSGPAIAAEAQPAAAPCSTEARLAAGGVFALAKDGTRVWYKTAGRPGAPTIIFLHGGPGYNAFVFEKSAGKLLEQRFSLIYLDQRGCGRSAFEGSADQYGMSRTLDDIEQIRALVGAEQLILAGHSFGGAVAAAYANRFPTRVAAIIMIDTAADLASALSYQVSYMDSIAATAFPDNAADVHALATSNATPADKLGKLYGLLGRLPLQSKLHYAVAANQERMEALDRESGFLDCTSSKVAPAFINEGYLTGSIPTVTLRLGAPTLLIAGRRSHVIGEDNIRSASKTWGASVEWIDAGHFVYFEKPEEFTAAVERFVSKNKAP